MLLRFFAIALFTLIAAMDARAETGDFAKRFVTVSPRPLPGILFEDDKGVTHDLKEYRGRFVLLNLWATWCAPCVNEMPSLNNLQDKFDYRDLNIVALNEDRNGLTAAQIFYARNNLKKLPIYVDASGAAPAALHARGLPLSILIDTNGNEIGHIDGEADWTAPDALAFLKAKIVR